MKHKFKIGGWDKTTKSWKLRLKGKEPIKKSAKQLSQIFDLELPNSETATRPYWIKYLEALQAVDKEVKAQASPLQTRIASLKTIIENYKILGKDTSDLEKELDAAINVPAHDIDHADLPFINPEFKKLATLAGIENNELAIHLLNQLTLKPIKAQDSLRKEADKFLEAEKGKAHYSHIRHTLNTFFESIGGDIDFRKLDKSHWDLFNEKIKSFKVSDRTKLNHQKRMTHFLKIIETGYNLAFGFLKLKKIEMPEGNKEQFTPDQLRTALDKATGSLRTTILLGLNCGWYWEDIAELKPEMVQTGRMVKGRSKNKNKLVASWHLWKETEKSLVENITPGMNHEKMNYKKFATENNLPSHKALRKTIAQMIQDKVGEEESRLYRCESIGGTHGKNYIRNYTEDQIKKLDKALKKIEKMLFNTK